MIQLLVGTSPAVMAGIVREEAIMVLAIVLIVLAVLLGLGGLIFTALKWLLIIAVVLLIAGSAPVKPLREPPRVGRSVPVVLRRDFSPFGASCPV